MQQCRGLLLPKLSGKTPLPTERVRCYHHQTNHVSVANAGTAQNLGNMAINAPMSIALSMRYKMQGHKAEFLDKTIKTFLDAETDLPGL
jgi:hypothetical protein